MFCASKEMVLRLGFARASAIILRSAAMADASGSRLHPKPALRVRMDTSSDEFDTYDLSEFTHEELEAMDNAAKAILQPGTPAGPLIAVVLEEETSRSPDIPLSPHFNLLKRFRKKRIMSVTDLVGPAWYASKDQPEKTN